MSATKKALGLGAVSKTPSRKKRAKGRGSGGAGAASRAGRSAKPRSDRLDQSPRRRRVASPVTAPLVFRRAPAARKSPAAKASPETRARQQARLAKRRHEERIWKAYQENPSAATRNALWEHYQTLVCYIAERQKTKLPACVDVQDLISAGNLGLQEAIAKFDLSRGVRFETYGVPRIRGAMFDAIRAFDWVPRLIRNKNHQYERLLRELGSELGREPTDEEVARRLDVDLPRLEKLKRELDVKAQISMEGAGSDNADPRDMLRLEMFEDPEPVEYTRELQREEVRGMALRGLHANEKAVVEGYYFRGRSMKEIGEELRLSESRICQIHRQVLEVLRKKFRAYRDSCAF